MKKCNKCGLEKPVSEYHKDRTTKTGLYGWCKQCVLTKARNYKVQCPEKVRESQRQSRLKRPDVYKNKQLRYAFGITLVEYNRMLEQQNGCCAICGEKETEIHHRSQKIRQLAVDHCHTTGAVRGLLCNSCNRGMGHFNDNPERLTAAAEYLKRNSPPAEAGGPNLLDN